MTFDEIVESVSLNEFTTSFLKGQLAYMEEEGKKHPEDKDEISAIKEKIKTHLAQVPEVVKKKQNRKVKTPFIISLISPKQFPKCTLVGDKRVLKQKNLKQKLKNFIKAKNNCPLKKD